MYNFLLSLQIILIKNKDMNYAQYEKALSSPRIERYTVACKNDKRKALILYRYNIKLCQKFYGVLGVLEVVLRNAVNEHYHIAFSDPEWLITQAGTGFLISSQTEIFKERDKLIRKGTYVHDKLVASLSFGTWTIMFSKNLYKNAGKTLLRIFPRKTHGMNQKQIYGELDSIRAFRNRIAHHEPICFDEAGDINVNHAKHIYDLILKYLDFMGYNPNEILYGVETPVCIFPKLQELADSI
jgi:hypothetical protein